MQHQEAREFEKAAQLALDEGKKLGADGVKVSFSSSKDKRLVVENGEFSLANAVDSKSFGVMVINDQRKGSSSLNSTDAASVKKAVRDALDLAKFSVPDPALILPSAEEAGSAKELDFLFDPALSKFELEDLQPMMQDALEVLLSDKRIGLDRFEMSVSEGYSILANSKGLMRGEGQTSLDWSYLALARDSDGNEVSGMDYDSGFSFALKGCKELLMEQVKEFKKRIIGNLKPKKAPSYKGLVIFSPRAVNEILLDTIFHHNSGHQIMDGRSRWIDSLGKKVMSDKITLIDEPHRSDLDGATGYDSDGLATKRQVLIDKGVLNMHLHSCYTANRMKTKPNAMSGGPFGLVMSGGTDALADLLKARKEILYVDRFSGNGDALTGDFSGVAKTSALYVDGKRAYPVSETMIAGNVFEMLNAIVGVSKEVENLSGDMIAPHVLLDHVSVSSS